MDQHHIRSVKHFRIRIYIINILCHLEYFSRFIFVPRSKSSQIRNFIYLCLNLELLQVQNGWNDSINHRVPKLRKLSPRSRKINMECRIRDRYNPLDHWHANILTTSHRFSQAVKLHSKVMAPVEVRMSNILKKGLVDSVPDVVKPWSLLKIIPSPHLN